MPLHIGSNVNEGSLCSRGKDFGKYNEGIEIVTRIMQFVMQSLPRGSISSKRGSRTPNCNLTVLLIFKLK